jgi:hypothetical protein
MRLWIGTIIFLFLFLFSPPIHFYYYYFLGILTLCFNHDNIFICSFFFFSILDSDNSGVESTSTANQSEFFLLICIGIIL